MRPRIVSRLAWFSRTALVAALLGATPACASAVDVHTIQAPAAHFDQYRTVAFDMSAEAPSEYVASPRSEDVRTRIHETAATLLRDRGYVGAEKEHADLVVKIEAGRRERRIRAPSETSISLPTTTPPVEPENAGVVPSYHGQLDEEERDFVEGAFVIDAFDGKTHELVWHGSARTEVRPGPVDYDRLRHAVESVLASFPAHGGR